MQHHSCFLSTVYVPLERMLTPTIRLSKKVALKHTAQSFAPPLPIRRTEPAFDIITSLTQAAASAATLLRRVGRSPSLSLGSELFEAAFEDVETWRDIVVPADVAEQRDCEVDVVKKIWID